MNDDVSDFDFFRGEVFRASYPVAVDKSKTLVIDGDTVRGQHISINFCDDRRKRAEVTFGDNPSVKVWLIYTVIMHKRKSKTHPLGIEHKFECFRKKSDYIEACRKYENDKSKMPVSL